MTRLHMLAAVVGVALFVAPAGAADIADVFPANTLAYAELHNPAELGPQLAAVFKGTAIEDSIPFIHGKKDGAKTVQELKAKHELAQFALFASPEVVAEFRKLGGVAVGLVGFSEKGEPEVAFAVLTGDSAAAGLAARAFVTMSPDVRKVGEVSKVPVFQHRSPAIAYDMNGQPKLSDEKPKEGAYELTYAYTPGLFVVGTSKAALAPVVQRFKGEEKGALSGTAGFKEAAAEYRKPGLFFYADAPKLFAAADLANRARGADAGSDLLAWLKLTAPPKALKSIAGCAQLRDNGLSLVLSERLDPAEKSPLMDFFAGPGVKIEALHHARKPAAFAATVNLPEKDRGTAFLGFCDTLAKGGGELGRLPSDVAKELGEKRKVDVNELLARVKAITVVVPAKQVLPKGAVPIPLFVVHAEDAKAAEQLEAFIPLLVAEIAGEKEPAQPSSETVDGVKLLSLAGTGLPWKAAVHYARKDAVLAWGLDRKLVAGALAPDAGGSVVGDKGLTLPPGAALAGVLNLGDLLTALDAKPVAGTGAVRPVEPPPRLPPGGSGAVAPASLQQAAEKARAAFFAAFGEISPAVVTVRRDRDQLKLEVFQPKVTNGGLQPVLGAGLDWLDKRLNLRDPNRPDVGLYPVPGRFPR